MGAGASIPTSEEAAKEAGYTDEQIAEYKAKVETEASTPAEAASAKAAPAEAATPEAAPAEAAPAETPTVDAEQEKSARVIQVAAKKKDERKVAKVRVAEQKIINSIGKQGPKSTKPARFCTCTRTCTPHAHSYSHLSVCIQGTKIAVEVSLDMQKKLHSAEFTEACAKMFASSDADKSGELVVGTFLCALVVLNCCSAGEEPSTPPLK